MTVAPTGDTVTVSTAELDRIAELLEITDTFLRANLTTVHRDLDELLLERGITGGPGWLIDSIGFTALGLRTIASTPAGGGHDE